MGSGSFAYTVKYSIPVSAFEKSWNKQLMTRDICTIGQLLLTLSNSEGKKEKWSLPHGWNGAEVLDFNRK